VKFVVTEAITKRCNASDVSHDAVESWRN
jgi:hypothetical protein